MRIAVCLTDNKPDPWVEGLQAALPEAEQTRGIYLAQRIADARADFIPGMGHDLPEELLPRFAQGIVDNARR